MIEHVFSTGRLKKPATPAAAAPTRATDSDASTILVIEDDSAMRKFLRGALESHGYRVVEAGSLADTATITTFDLALLDLGLPDGDGLRFVRTLRGSAPTPVIVLSARDREDDKVAALDAGADDYLTKPFGIRELLARMRVALRHTMPTPTATEPTVLEVGPIAIDRERHEVCVGGTAIHLTPIEFALLVQLARHAGKVVTHGQLLSEVWGPRGHDHTHYLRVHMAALRRKVEADPARPRWLVTEQGVGYRLRDE